MLAVQRKSSMRLPILAALLALLAGHDLREFFGVWGLRASAEADARLDAAEYATPDEVLSAIFE
jgi:hypothetical protein